MVESTDYPEWLQPPARILVRHRERLGGLYFVLRPAAIVYAALFWALRGVLVLIVLAGWWVFWLLERMFVAMLGGLEWLLFMYARFRWGRAAADELRGIAAEAEAAGREWRKRFNARVARRAGWPSDNADSP